MTRGRVGALVGVATLVGVVTTVAGGIAQAWAFHPFGSIGLSEVRYRLLLLTQVLGPALGALTLLAALASLALRHRVLATATFAAAVLVSVGVAVGSVNDAGITFATTTVRLGAILQLLATMPLSLAAAWLAWSAQAVADPAGEPSDGGLGGGHGVGEAELDGLG